MSKLYAELTCPECGEIVWDGPQGSKLAKCWNAEQHESGRPLAFDTMDDEDEDDPRELGSHVQYQPLSATKRFDVAVNLGTSFYISRGSFDSLEAAIASAESWREAAGKAGRYKITDEIGCVRCEYPHYGASQDAAA